MFFQKKVLSLLKKDMGRKKIPENQLKEMIVIGIEKFLIEKIGGHEKVVEIAKKAIYKLNKSR